jgi:hypothetical protein
MNSESAVILIWLLPVVVQIILPLVMLLVFGIGRLFSRIFGYRQSAGNLNLTTGIHGKSVGPAAGVMT